MRRPTGHVDPDVLAELSAGLIGGRRATRIHAHLAGCERCAGMCARLSEVSIRLAAVPSPAMPDPVTSRLTAAIAAEAAARSGPVPDAAGPAAPPVTRPAGRSRRGAPRIGWGWPRPVAVRALAAAAAVCVLAIGGYTLSQLTSPGRPGSPGAPAHSGRARQQPGAAITPKNGLSQPQRTAPAAGPAREGPLLKFTLVRSGTDFQPSRLAGQISSELGRLDRDPRALPAHAPDVAQRDCVATVTGGNQPSLVDQARYRGRPAMVIALAPAAAQYGQAWVVGAACSGRSSDVLTHVTLARPGG